MLKGAFSNNLWAVAVYSGLDRWRERSATEGETMRAFVWWRAFLLRRRLSLVRHDFSRATGIAAACNSGRGDEVLEAGRTACSGRRNRQCRRVWSYTAHRS